MTNFISPEIDGSVAQAMEIKNLFREVSAEFFENFVQHYNSDFEKLSGEDVRAIETQLKKSLARITGAVADSDEIDFLSKMLHLIPSRRWTADELLQHSWLKQ